MRILILNQPYWPDVVSTAQHLADWTDHLTAQGHSVTVIASRSVYGKQGAVLPKRETYKGVQIYRVGSNLFRKGRILTRLVDFGLFQLLALCKALFLPRQDVVVCLTTPPFIGVVGRIVKLFRGSRYVQWEMDLYPDVPIALGVMKPRSLVSRLFERIHRRLLKKADRVIVLGRCMQRVIAAKGIAPEKLALITPWSDPQEIRPVAHEENPFRKEHGLEGKRIIMYAGNLGLGHDITTILTAMERLKGDSATRFVFVGGGRRMQEIKGLIDERGLPNALLLDYVAREKLGEMLAAADVHLITQAPGTSGLIVPSKLYGILAAGRPSIYIGPDDTEIAYTLKESAVGTVLPIGDVEGFLTAVNNLSATPSDEFAMRARTILEKTGGREVCVHKLTTLVESLVAKNRR